MDVNYLISNNCFKENMPLTEISFMRYCSDRGMPGFWPTTMCKYEKHKLIRPTLIIRRPLSSDKPDRHRKCAGISFNNESFKALLKEGYIESVNDNTYRPWNELLDPETKEQMAIKCYSTFQVIIARKIYGNFQAGFESGFFTQIKGPLTHNNFVEFSNVRLKHIQDANKSFEKLLYLLLLIQNKYIPYTRTDGETLRLHSNYDEWEKWKERFDPNDALERACATVEEVRKWRLAFSVEANALDPIVRWKRLTDYFSYDKKMMLKGDALLAQDYYCISKILSMFMQDVTGEVLQDSEEEWAKKVYGNIINNRYKMLNYVCSEFNIHPNPRFILYAEDLGLCDYLVPTLFPDLHESGIEIRHLNLGDFKADKLLLPIDNFLSNEIGVYLVCDNENNAQMNIKKLVKKLEIHSEAYRKHKQNLFKCHIWKKNLEFDNFSDEEIAKCLTLQAENGVTFSAEDVHKAREQFGGKGKIIEDIFGSKSSGELSKSKLSSALARVIIDDVKKGKDISSRLIVTILREIIDKAFSYRRSQLPSQKS